MKRAIASTTLGIAFATVFALGIVPWGLVRLDLAGPFRAQGSVVHQFECSFVERRLASRAYDSRLV